ncbi:PrgI family protein [Candidatus Uhrbacteria bacterium]|nr:PrgI family protein [Candidatus Uhrbacteria bacterium]
MPRYVVPQFIDAEDKILGPLTTRQFLIMLVTAFLMFIEYKAFDFGLFIFGAVFTFAIGGTLAFFKVNGQPVHFFILNLIQTLRRPGLRTWDKDFTDAELRELLKAPPPPPKKVRVIKTPIEASRLAELSLTVNTGGVYNADE